MITQEISLLTGNVVNDINDFFVVEYSLKCETDPNSIMDKMKEVLLALNYACLDEKSFELIDWKNILPRWFVSKFRPEKTEKEKTEYLKWWDSLSIEEKNEQGTKKQIWSLGNWIHWMDPDQREWYWHQAQIINNNEIRLSILVYGHPFPDGSLKWLAETAGCSEIKQID